MIGVTSAGEVGLTYWRQHDRNICMERIEAPCTVLHLRKGRSAISTCTSNSGRQASGFPKRRASRRHDSTPTHAIDLYRDRYHLMSICIYTYMRACVCACICYMGPLSHVRPRCHCNPGPVCLHPKLRMRERAFPGTITTHAACRIQIRRAGAPTGVMITTGITRMSSRPWKAAFLRLP